MKALIGILAAGALVLSCGGSDGADVGSNGGNAGSAGAVNAGGVGASDAGSDSASGDTCLENGELPSKVRMTEVHYHPTKYIVLKNLDSCGVRLDTLVLQMSALYYTGYEPTVIDLPKRVLAPNESVYITSEAVAAGDFRPDSGVPIIGEEGGYVMLCDGACAEGTVQDYLVFNYSDPTAPKNGASFDNSSMVTYDGQAFVRIAFGGQYPSFKASDWQVAAASRPNPSYCPATQPVAYSKCSLADDQYHACTYGIMSCSCDPVVHAWNCE